MLRARDAISGNRSDPVLSEALVWQGEPISFALSEAGARRENLATRVPRPICALLGRRLLLAQFEFSDWVLRRVEKVSFASDRRVARSSTVEFRVPDEAPVLQADDGSLAWLVPITVMRRRTLVNLDIRDENGDALSLLGLRFTQRLDESMLRAAACLVHDDPQAGPLPDAIEKFIATAISGKWKKVLEVKEQYDGRSTADPALRPYFENELFRAALERMWHNFTLYVTLPVQQGRHRMLRLSFEERIVWRYQKPVTSTKKDTFHYEPMRKALWWVGSFWQWLGLGSTRIRFLTPTAEHCASYHFEFVAPTTLGVSKASLLAGRPNPPPTEGAQTPLSWDEVENPGHSAGLHAVEVPAGSLCRTQVNLRIASRGWLSTMLVSCWAIAVVMFTVWLHAGRVGESDQWGVDQVTNIVLLLVTVTAGAATYVAQHHAVDVAARMVSGLRAIGTLALAVPAVAAVKLVYLRDKLDSEWAALHKGELRHVLLGLFLFACAVALLISAAWLKTLHEELRRGRPSPWDMTQVNPGGDARPRWHPRSWLPQRGDKDEPRGISEDFWTAAKQLQFTKKAIGVASAEGWLEEYWWSNDRQQRAVALLKLPAEPPDPATCRCTASFEHSQLSLGLSEES